MRRRPSPRALRLGFATLLGVVVASWTPLVASAGPGTEMVGGSPAAASPATAAPSALAAAGISIAPPPTPAPTPLPTPPARASTPPAPVSTTPIRRVPAPTPTPRPLARPAVRGAAAVRAVALGDSLTAWPSGYPWPSRLDAEDPSIVLVHNAGVPGNTTAQMLARFGRSVVPYAPRLLFVLGGTNDVGLGVPQATTIANLRAIVRAGKARGMTVVLLTIPPDSYPGLVTRVRSLNASIRRLAAAERVSLADIYWPLATRLGLYQPRYTIDGLHFTALGAQVVANTVFATLRPLGL